MYVIHISLRNQPIILRVICIPIVLSPVPWEIRNRVRVYRPKHRVPVKAQPKHANRGVENELQKLRRCSIMFVFVQQVARSRVRGDTQTRRTKAGNSQKINRNFCF